MSCSSYKIRCDVPEELELSSLTADGLEGALQSTPRLTMLGLCAILDPPREEAIAAVKEAHRAGIVVKMITGEGGGGNGGEGGEGGEGGTGGRVEEGKGGSAGREGRGEKEGRDNREGSG
jgi:hypothetical protein